MKFKQINEGEWGCYSNPFSFWIFDDDDSQFHIIWHYGNATGDYILLNGNIEKAKSWCSEFALKKTLKQLETIKAE